MLGSEGPIQGLSPCPILGESKFGHPIQPAVAHLFLQSKCRPSMCREMANHGEVVVAVAVVDSGF